MSITVNIFSRQSTHGTGGLEMCNTSIIAILTMLFCHIVDDYYLQGWLASAKQHDWWIKNAPEELYKHDYIMALTEHAFSWCFMVHVPCIVCWACNYIYFPPFLLIISFLLHLTIHAVVDDLKANKKKINLIQDQIIHITQVVIIWILFFVV